MPSLQIVGWAFFTILLWMGLIFLLYPRRRLQLRDWLITALSSALLSGLLVDIIDRGGRLPFTW